jgi:hypothetical protein
MFNFFNFLIMIQSMKGTKPYLYFLNSANTDATFQASDLMWMRAATGGGDFFLDLYFRTPRHYAADLTDDSTDASAQTWATRTNCKIRLTLNATGDAKKVIKTIISAINSPITVGDPNNRFDRGFIVVADEVNSSYVDKAITAVDSITFDARATDAVA